MKIKTNGTELKKDNLKCKKACCIRENYAFLIEEEGLFMCVCGNITYHVNVHHFECELKAKKW